jgi:uncharacterized protein DUF2703
MATATRHLQIDFLFLDLETCTRCRATDAALAQALELTRPVLDVAGIGVSVTKTRVTDERQAREQGFVSSPTIRVNGVDIAGHLVESACETCAEACACEGGIDCRDWIWRGERSTEPPVGLIVEAIMAHAFDGRFDQEAPGGREEETARSGRLLEVPDNLRRFFDSQAAGPRGDAAEDCCGAAEQASCCEPDAKEACCGSIATTSSACGCR